MSEPKASKRRLYIVGGKGKNVPSWLSAAFDYEQFEQDHAKTRTLDPEKKPDAVIVLSSWVGHEHFYGARDLAEKLNIPMLLSPGGWSASLKAAADLGVEWFINDIEAAKHKGAPSKEQVADVEEFIDNAWREAYNREWSAREALVKRYTKTLEALEHSQQELTRFKTKDAAAQRVIAEVRAAAAEQRAALKEIESRNQRVSEALAAHIDGCVDLFRTCDSMHQMLGASSSRLAEVRQEVQQKLDLLRSSMVAAEAGPPPSTESHNLDEEASSEPVSASNAELES